MSKGWSKNILKVESEQWGELLAVSYLKAKGKSEKIVVVLLPDKGSVFRWWCCHQ